MAEAIRGVEGLDLEQWRRDVDSDIVADAYRRDWEETRRPTDFVRDLEGDRMGIGSMKHSEGHDRYAFPTLVFSGPDGEATVRGWMPYDAYVDAMEAAAAGSTTDPRPDPTPAEAFERWPLLTEVEFALLCGEGAALPDGTVTHDWGDGVVHLTPAEAAARGLAA